MRRICREVQAQLPRVTDGALPGWRWRLVERHVRGCADCAAELERQRVVAEGLRDLSERAEPETEPPPELLESILARAHEPGVRARAAVPVRGAVSGARPELSVAAVLLVLLVAYLCWRAVRLLLPEPEERSAA